MVIGNEICNNSFVVDLFFLGRRKEDNAFLTLLQKLSRDLPWVHHSINVIANNRVQTGAASNKCIPSGKEKS